MEAKTPTIEDLIQTVRDLASESPDNIYNRPEGMSVCLYNKGICTNGSVGCIFGQAFRKLGIEVDEDGWIVIVLITVFGYQSSSQNKWCSFVQCNQDRQKTWGECIKIADEEVK